MSKLLESVENAATYDVPWDYVLFDKPLTEEQIQEIKHAEIDRENYINDGTRSGDKAADGNSNHNVREYVTKENADKYPHLCDFIEDLKTPEVRKTIAKLIGRDDSFDGSYVRLEVIHDTKSFWLEPHCDIPEKLISSLVYINMTDEDKNLGTDLYNDDMEVVETVPFEHNLGFIFAGPNKWHGVQKGKNIKVERRGIQLNYVTFPTDWPVEG